MNLKTCKAFAGLFLLATATSVLACMFSFGGHGFGDAEYVALTTSVMAAGVAVFSAFTLAVGTLTVRG